MAAGPSYVSQPMAISPLVYNYANPRTGEHVVSLLPPHHPEMICLQAGEHIPHTRYSILGAWFTSLLSSCCWNYHPSLCRDFRCHLLVSPWHWFLFIGQAYQMRSLWCSYWRWSVPLVILFQSLNFNLGLVMLHSFSHDLNNSYFITLLPIIMKYDSIWL